MESNADSKEKKKINEDLVVFMRKRSDTEAPRYTARLKTYVDLQQKRRRAASARRHSEHYHTCSTKKAESDQKEKNPDHRPNVPNAESSKRRSLCGVDREEGGEHPGSDDGRVSRSSRRGSSEDDKMRGRSYSHSEPSEGCCPKRKKKKRCGRKKKRKRSCKRKKKRRRSCGKKKRRKRRRSCGKKKKKRRC